MKSPVFTQRVDDEVVIDVELNSKSRRLFWLTAPIVILLGDPPEPRRILCDVVIRRRRQGESESADTLYREGPYDRDIAWDITQVFKRQIGACGLQDFLYKKVHGWKIEN